MSMPLEKATKILTKYKENNFNGEKTLQEVGYSKSMARGNSKASIQSAKNVIIKAVESGVSVKKNILDIVGYTEKEVIGNYRSVVEQNKDLPSKLKAMRPLLKHIGVELEEEQTKVTVPVLNITTRGEERQINEKTDIVSVSDSENTALNKDIPPSP